ncbi:efflux RND transporter periplasmic adaptor subunit [Shewanella gaetbuli]|uniref:Efflux RND transporter periplasmic adaptor subunit n=1 Tax=Shewanella gaetbuli TaxID=220752 RepID=A0A9X1ZJE9_9GAMM|nr:efflux RND transporter periplasmic adaptor subunit [Shewanella gaetbuli]MCL1142616.1 efflux RND transporter periplasmic adaptor subunit [Shewanella gaetbuli]
MDRFKNIKRTAVALSCITILFGCTAEEEQQQEQQEFAVPVETTRVQTGNVSSFYSTTATLEAPLEAHVMTRVSGLIETINVEEGDQVTKGQVLATIDAKRQQYDFNRAQAEVQIIEQELNRLRKMTNKEFISQDTMAKLEFNLQAAMAKRDLAELQVKESQIVSPIDGVVAKRHVKQGNMVQEFDKLFYVLNQDELYGIVHLPEQQLPNLQLGQHASVIQAQTNANEFDASVLRISPIVDAQSGTFKVTLKIPNQNKKLKAGMFTRVELKYDTHNNVVTVPYNALINQDDTQAIYVIEDDKAQRREVQIGYRQNNTVEVTSGVIEGEQIVIRGQQNLKDQSLVEVINPLSIAAVQ